MSDQTYIDNIKAQVKGGMYDHLFKGKRDLVFLDIGANVGIVSIYAVPYCKRIVAVEPNPWTYSELRKNTRNYIAVNCIEAALAPIDSHVPFFVNDINFTASSTVNTYGKEIAVQGITLASLLEHCNLTHVDICKVDAEGAEGESLDYYQLYACRTLIDTYYIETHNCPKTTWEHKLGTIVGNLARCGYVKQTIDGMAVTATRV